MQAEAGVESMRILDYGAIDLTDLPETSQRLYSCKIIYGINHNQYSTRTLHTINNDKTVDRDQMLWELSRSYTEPPDNYYFSFIKLRGNNGTGAVETFGVKRRAFSHLGALFDKGGLVLHQLMFEPEVLCQMTRKLVTERRSAILFIEKDQAHLQVYLERQLVAVRSLLSIDAGNASGRRKLVEEIGVILLGVPADRVRQRDLELILIGAAPSSDLAAQLAAMLPYDIHMREVTLSAFAVDTPDAFTDEFGRYFLPFSLAYLYYRDQVCESSPEINGVSSSRA